MRVYHHLNEFTALPYAVATTGTFDGVHIGHKTILRRLIELARREGGESVLLTFYPHPRQVLQPDAPLKMLNTIEEKIDLMRTLGLDHLIIHPFDRSFSRTSSLEFVRNILVEHIGVKRLVIGYDHHFGRNREGSFSHLVEYGPLYGFQVEEIPAKDIDEVAVSSTKIRKALTEGDVEKAREFLGYPYAISGVVVKGDQLGRTIGFPTANISMEQSDKLIPARGVYAVRAETSGRTYAAMCNIGFRPTLQGNHERVEVHLFNMEEDIYDRDLRIHFVERLRSEKRFANMNALQEQLQKDRQRAQQLLQRTDT